MDRARLSSTVDEALTLIDDGKIKELSMKKKQNTQEN